MQDLPLAGLTAVADFKAVLADFSHSNTFDGCFHQVQKRRVLHAQGLSVYRSGGLPLSFLGHMPNVLSV